MIGKPLRRLACAYRDETVKEALVSYAGDVRRMKSCLLAAGYEVNEEDLASAWLYFSEGFAATWLALPDDDRHLLTDLLDGKTPPLVPYPQTGRSWIVQVADGRDSGSSVLDLPHDFVQSLGWSSGVTLEASCLPSGEVRLRRI